MWFCCCDCQKISHSLQELTVNGPEKLPEPLLKSIKNEQNEGTGAELDVKWRIINWKVASDEESELLLSEALAIFHVSLYVLAVMIIECSELFMYL